MTGAGYRTKQFFWALFAKKSLMEDERYVVSLRDVDNRLTPAERRLFATMDSADQRHCLDVFCLLREWGHDDEDLLRAALLHDVGKGLARVRLWHRVAIVLANAVHRRIVDRLQSDRPASWRYPFCVHRQHAELGARLAEGAGCRPRVVDLIRRHDTSSGDELAEALHRADRVC